MQLISRFATSSFLPILVCTTILRCFYEVLAQKSFTRRDHLSAVGVNSRVVNSRVTDIVVLL